MGEAEAPIPAVVAVIVEGERLVAIVIDGEIEALLRPAPAVLYGQAMLRVALWATQRSGEPLN